MTKSEIITIIVIVFLLLVLSLMSGCFFVRVDYETCGTRVSGTLWTIGKRISIDPNDGYSSDNDSINMAYPPLIIDTGPRPRQNSNLWEIEE